MRNASALPVALALAAVTLLALSPALSGNFTSYDDSAYVTANPHVTGGLTLVNAEWAFTSAYASNWHPLTWLSHQADVSLFGLSPLGHHLTNLVLHVVATVLLFLWLQAATGKLWRSAFVALLFGIHPLHVESVAWIAERKDVLSGLFLMLTLLAYSYYVRKPGAARYALVAFCLAAGLLSKATLVTVPLLLLLVDWWPLARIQAIEIRKAVTEKIALAGLSALAAAAAIWSQRQGGSVVPLDQLPLLLRLSNAAVSYLRYLGKTVWPVDLAAFYPYPPDGIPLWLALAAVALLIAISIGAWRVRRSHPWLAVGWGWYLVSLLPVIGIVQVGMQSIADRYMYLPLIGLAIAVTWECAELAARRGQIRLAAVSAAAIAVACATLTWRQTQFWKDGVTLFTHAAAVTENNFVAHDNLGVELDRLGQPDAAIAEYRETLRIKPGDRNGERNLSQALFAQGERLFNQDHIADSLAAFREGLRYQPANPTALKYEGVALARTGDTAAAEQALAASVRLDPRNLEAQYDLGLIRAARGNTPGALAAFDAALRLQPNYPPAQAAKSALQKGGQPDLR